MLFRRINLPNPKRRMGTREKKFEKHCLRIIIVPGYYTSEQWYRRNWIEQIFYNSSTLNFDMLLRRLSRNFCHTTYIVTIYSFPFCAKNPRRNVSIISFQPFYSWFWQSHIQFWTENQSLSCMTLFFGPIFSRVEHFIMPALISLPNWFLVYTCVLMNALWNVYRKQYAY